MQIGIYLISVIAATVFSFAVSANESTTLAWEDLVPPKGKGEILSIPGAQEVIGALKRDTFEGSDEDFEYLNETLEAQRYTQPQGAKIRSELDGKVVRIPGYVTPIGFEEENLTEFLLVPYVGACIHVPPPPGNQIVYVTNAKGLDMEKLYDPIWITGKLSASPVATVLADVGYRIDGAVVEPYEE